MKMAAKFPQDERDGYRQQCRGMYAKNAMEGSVDPYINVIFIPSTDSEPQIVSLIIFGWSDALDVGVPEADGMMVFLNLSWLIVEGVYLRSAIY